MNSEIINWLNNNFGYNISTNYYNNISVWKDWWKGFHEPFHRITFENGEKRKSRDMYTMKWPKGVRGLGKHINKRQNVCKSR